MRRMTWPLALLLTHGAVGTPPPSALAQGPTWGRARAPDRAHAQEAPTVMLPLRLPRRGAPALIMVPMPSPVFTALLAQMQQLAFGDQKINLAEDAARAGARLTCLEIVQLMRTTSFGDEQVRIAAILYPSATDPEGLPLITSALTFEEDRVLLRRLLGK